MTATGGWLTVLQTVIVLAILWPRSALRGRRRRERRRATKRKKEKLQRRRPRLRLRRSAELRIVYGTTTGTARRFATTLSSEAPSAAHWHGIGRQQQQQQQQKKKMDVAAGRATRAALTIVPAIDADGADAWELLDGANDERDGTATRWWSSW